MKTLYEAQNGLEAHMIVDLLEQAHLHARVDGEFLQGGVGEIQAAGIVRVMVAEDDYELALDMIKHWDAAQPRIENGNQQNRSPWFSIIVILVIGMFLGATITSYLR